MIQSANHERQTAFSRWLRTGRLPRISNPDVVEFKFNHWHDPADGRFTFAGSGRAYGRSDGNGSSGGGRSGSGGSPAARSAGALQSRNPEDRHKPRAVPAPHPQSKISRPAATSPRAAKPNPKPKNGLAGGGSQVVAAVASEVAGPYRASPGLMILKNSGRCQAAP